ncbi:MAG TPA: helix-turn-helix domain-containing protein, partial [Bacteroidales bacterium]|nr:helix-turn-helix domain-containing protein [Bacteroidales bacterium]
LRKYIPEEVITHLPVKAEDHGVDYMTDRDIIFKILYQLRQEIEEIKASIGRQQIQTGSAITKREEVDSIIEEHNVVDYDEDPHFTSNNDYQQLSIHSMNADFIRRALEKHNGKRKAAAAELGISERTLYRKIKELNLDI